MIDLASTGLRRYARLANKIKHKYGLFDKFQLALIGVYDVSNNPRIFLTGANKHIQEIFRHFDGTLNHFGSMVFSANQEKMYPTRLRKC